jgi:hypothetical protein
MKVMGLSEGLNLGKGRTIVPRNGKRILITKGKRGGIREIDLREWLNLIQDYWDEHGVMPK